MVYSEWINVFDRLSWMLTASWHGGISCLLTDFLHIPIFFDIWAVLMALRLLWYLYCGFRMVGRLTKDNGRIPIQIHHELLLSLGPTRELSSLSEQWYLRSDFGVSSIFPSCSSAYVQHLCFFRKSPIAFQSSVVTDCMLCKCY